MHRCVQLQAKIAMGICAPFFSILICIGVHAPVGQYPQPRHPRKWCLLKECLLTL